MPAGHGNKSTGITPVQPGVQPPSPNAVSVLTASHNKTVKRYILNDAGTVQSVPYGNEKYFSCKVHPVNGILQLATLIEQLSSHQNKIIIRGQPPVQNSGYVERNKANYAEPDAGLSWAMLDFDNLVLPEGISPTSIAAIEHVIAKLPEPFQQATYYYQFSSSTGIVQPDGTPLKTGLNVHLFFWFARPVTGHMLDAYLKHHCIQTDFLERTVDKGGIPAIRYGVDFSLFRTVQPHYVAAPIIEAGVACTLDHKQRQGLIQKPQACVELPELDDTLPQQVQLEHNKLRDEHKRACGFIKTQALTKLPQGGIAEHSYYRNPNPSAISTGRALAEVKVTERLDRNERAVSYATLYFLDENSPGSWYVSSKHPCFARRHGDAAEIALKELSGDAYNYVRDTLEWFSDIAMQTLPLTEQGYLPSFSSFATARNNLIIAPTGSGKTTAFCEFARRKSQNIIIYAAQTIALTQQMKADLLARNIRVTHYQELRRCDLVSPGVYVTTNKSMDKIVDQVRASGQDFILVIDEIHMALDDFMHSNKKNELLENTITRATQSYFLTATLTSLQLKKLTETISTATGELSAENFGYYEFNPIKSNPLWWADMKAFGRDFVALLRHYQELKNRGEALPRTIIIAPTSKMRRFEVLLEAYGLSDDTEIVSRNEATQDEIEVARVSDKPILISSPLFALGLNFEHPPARFWTYFQYLNVDTSQIIQTLNRANRTDMACEVRLYSEALNPTPFALPSAGMERIRIEEYFLDESGFQGVLDAHYQVDRATYNALRLCEKVTAKALYQLKNNDAIQNYRILEQWDDPLSATEEDEEAYKAAKASAKISYADDVVQHLPKYMQESWPLLTHYLAKLSEEGRSYNNAADKLIKDIQDQEKAVAMCLTQIQDVSIGNKVNARRLRVLFGDAPVFLSAQYKWEISPEWMKVAAEKTGDSAQLISALKALKAGTLNGVSFGKKLRLPTMRRAVLALTCGETDYVQWQKTLEKLDALADEHKNKASKARRGEIDKEFFQVARDFLETIGVWFLKEKGAKGRWYLDPDQPVVPDWDLDEMERVLQVKAESLKHVPVTPINVEVEDLKWADAPVRNALCRECVHCTTSLLCNLGRPIEPHWNDGEVVTKDCDAYKLLPQKLRFYQPA